MWILGGMGGMIVILLSVIVYFLKTDKESTKEILGKHEGWFLGQQREIHELSTQTKMISEQTRAAIELIQVEQAGNNERLLILIDHIKERKRK